MFNHYVFFLMEHPSQSFTPPCSLSVCLETFEGLDKNNKSMFPFILLQPAKSEAIGTLGAFLKQHFSISV